MANNIVVGSKYNPFSFQELLAPVQIADAMHKQTEEDLGALSAQASVWENLASKEADPQAHAMYTKYANDLNEQVESLARSGLNPQTRRGLNTMRTRYGQEIVPIEQAFARRKELTDEQRQAALRDSTIMFNTDAASLSLDSLIKDPNLSYSSYSGALIEKQVSDAASNIARELRDDPNSKWKGIINSVMGHPQYYEKMLSTGLTSDQVLATILDDPNGEPVLRRIIDSAVSSSGIPTWGDEKTLGRAYEHAYRGAYSAIGQSKPDRVANQDIGPMWQMAAINARKKGTDDSANSQRLPFKPVKLTDVNKDIKTVKLDEEFQFMKKYYEDLASGDLSFIGKKEIRQKRIPRDPSVQGGTGALFRPYTEEEYMPNQERFEELSEKYGSKDPAELMNKIESKIQSSVIRHYSYDMDLTDNDLMAQSISRAMNTWLSENQEQPLQEIKSNGTIKDTKDIKDKKVTFTKDGNLRFMPGKGLIWTERINDEVRNFVIEPQILDDFATDNVSISELVAGIPQAIEDGRRNSAITGINLLFNALNNRFMSTKIQSKSSSEVEPSSDEEIAMDMFQNFINVYDNE